MALLLIFIGLNVFPGDFKDILVPSWYDPAVHSNKVNNITYRDITVRAENLAVTGDFMIFDVEIINELPYGISLNDSNMYLLASGVPYPPEGSAEEIRAFEEGMEKNYPFAGQEIAAILKSRIDEHRKKSLLMGLLGAGLVIFDAALDARDFRRAELHGEKIPGGILRDVVTGLGLAATDRVRFKADRERWQDREDLFYLDKELLKEGFVGTGESVRGKVFFPVRKEQYIRLIVLLDHTAYVLDFRWAGE